LPSREICGAIRFSCFFVGQQCDLLDEIELNRRLKISLEQADRGETMSLEEMENELLARKAK